MLKKQIPLARNRDSKQQWSQLRLIDTTLEYEFKLGFLSQFVFKVEFQFQF